MLTKIKSQGITLLWPVIIGVLLSIGLVVPVLKAAKVEGTSVAIWASLLTGLACFVMQLAGRGWRRMAAIAGCAVAFILLGTITGTLRNLYGLAMAAVHLINGNTGPLALYAPEGALIAGCLVTLAGYYMGRSSGGFYPAVSLAMVVLLLLWFTDGWSSLWYLAPALLAMCMMLARSISDTTPPLRIVSVSAIVVVLALAITPVLQFRSTTLETFAENLNNYIVDTFFFTQPRSVYSIEADGYKPLQTRLGGKVELSDRPVMTVETPTNMLLRGVVYNHYTGLGWRDTQSSRRYLYSDVRNRALREDTLDETRPSESLREGSDLFRLANISVTMQSSSASTLFMPARSEDISLQQGMVMYFNQAGELFITRDLEPGDKYSFFAPVILAGDERLPALLSSASMGTDDYDVSPYTTLHDQIAPAVYTLTEQITADTNTPYERARAIQQYLRTTFPYTLSPDMPPDNQDFVSHFLLAGRKGYCTYFASAMAVMGRIAGLPTRYVEGYLVQPAEGVALVTSKDAHAWAEVYFAGFGWVAFDATPSGAGGRSNPDGQGNDQDVTWYQPPEEQAPEDVEEIEAPEDGGGDQGQGQQEEDDTPQEEPTPTPTPPPTPTPDPDNPQATPSPMPVPQETPPDDERKSPSLWWIWLVLLAIIGLLIWRMAMTNPEIAAGRLDNETAKIMLWYRALLGLLAASGMPARTHESPLAYATRVEQGIPSEAGFMAVAESVVRRGYARQSVTREEVQHAAKCYRTVWHAVPLKGRIKWLMHRMLHGIGSIEQVP